MVITDLRVGGVPLHLFRLAKDLHGDEFQIHVACLASRGPVGERFEQETDIPVSYCHARRKRDLRTFWRLRRIIRQVQPDLVHAVLFHANIAARLVAPLAGIPRSRVISEIQTVELDKNWHLTLDRLTIGRTAVEIGNAQAVVDHLHHVGGVPMSKLHLIPGGVDVEAIAHAVPLDRKDAGVPEDEPIFIWVGRLDPVKGFEEMIEGFALAAAERPCRLWLVGEGPYRAAVEALVRKFKLTHRIQLLGNRDDVPRLLRTANVFLLPSRTEGRPNALLEAMAAGLPPITTDIAGCREVVDAEKTGLLVPVRHPQEIAKAIIRLIKNKDLARRIGRAAGEAAAQHFSHIDQFRQYRDLYRRLLSDRHQRRSRGGQLGSARPNAPM